MKQKVRILLLIVSLIAVGTVIYMTAVDRISEAEPLPEKAETIALHQMFFDRQAFDIGNQAAAQVAARDDVRAVVVPHHLTAADLIARRLKAASGREIASVIIIGPNHDNIGGPPVAVTKASWQTPLGKVAADEELVDKMSGVLGLTPSAEPFLAEHSVGAIVPFVHHYFEEARVVPIILASYAGRQEAEALSTWLAEELPEDTLIIVSTDFSHYLAKPEADARDAMSRRLIEERDIRRILELDNRNVDSPPALATVLLYAEEQKLKTRIIDNKNSYDYTDTRPSETTSYFAISIEE